MGQYGQEHVSTAEELMQELRIKATEHLIREEWQDSIQVYSRFIKLCQEQISNTHQQDQITKLQKSLCLALSNRAECLFRQRDLSLGLRDCDQALEIDSAHVKSLVCKGKILLSFNRYSMALDCFKAALLDPQENANLETLNGYLDKCKKLEFQSKTGYFDLSDWVLSGFRGKPPEMAEYIGPVQIKRSELSGRGLFAIKNIDAGTVMLVTKAIATERGIVSAGGPSENAQMVMWKNFVDKVVESAIKCKRIHQLISTLSAGEDGDNLEVPEISLFRPEAELGCQSNEKPDMVKILSILDVNSLVEDSVSAKVFGKNSDYYGIGLWVLASFINHSCKPNARRLHVGDHVVVHASRDIKAGEEITFAYFDVFCPLEKRKEMSLTWGFQCACKRCKFEEEVCSKQDMKEIEMLLERGIDAGSVVFRLEERMRRWTVRGNERGYLRASFWNAYGEAYGSEKLIRKWRGRIPATDVVVDSVVDVNGSDDRLLRLLREELSRGGGNVVDMEKTMKLSRGIYGKVVKKQAMRSLLELGSQEQML
ncbi:hypothetical protein K2173_017056 [Erythroxylum novogranatense]|uniref:SET domain-containing protein n=1 Tax=Erythroxylum novogranatense TaxID=1862640 RepID=A0AAV8U5P8_9ROSI|nr:hypothetical protein K2173_017056 [Erythroxylum novogranatense]